MPDEGLLGSPDRGLWLRDDEQLVLDELRKVDGKLAAMYFGALVALQDDRNPDRFAQAACSLRDVMDRLPGKTGAPVAGAGKTDLDQLARGAVDAWQNDPASRKFAKCMERLAGYFSTSLSKREKARRLHHHLDPVKGWSPDELSARQWETVRKRFDALTHHGSSGASDEDFRKRLTEFNEAVLAVLRPRTYDDFRRIELLIAEGEAKGPSEEVVRGLLDLAGLRAENYRHLFESLRSPVWLAKLKGQLPRGDSGSSRAIHSPDEYWIEVEYLRRVAKEAPVGVREALKKFPETRHPRTQHQVIECALDMPAKQAAELAGMIAGFVEVAGDSLLADPCVELIEHLLRGGFTDDATKIAKPLLRFEARGNGDVTPLTGRRLTRAVGLLDAVQHEKAASRVVAAVADVDPVKALRFACKMLQRAIDCTSAADGQRQGSDLLGLAAIEDHPQNDRHQPYVLPLTRIVRDTAQELTDSHPEHVLRVLGEYSRCVVFRRIELHLRRANRELDPLGTIRILTDPETFRDHWTHHERYLLLEDRFGDLTKEQQQVYLDHVAEESDPENIRNEETCSRETDEEILRIARLRCWKGLWPVRDHLSEPLHSELDALVEEFGEPEQPGFVFWHRPMWVGPTSSTSVEELAAMSDDAVLRHLSEFTPSGELRSPSVLGLARELENAVAASPLRFARIAARFEEVHPYYAGHLLRGIGKAIRVASPDGPALDLGAWRSVLGLCEWIVAQSGDEEWPPTHTEDGPATWTRTRRDVASLLDATLGSDAIPRDYEDVVWSLLEVLCEDPDPSVVDSSFEPAQHAINSTRGLAMHCLVQHSVWLASRAEELGTDFDLGQAPNVREVLERHLDPKHDGSSAIRAVYGMRFAQLVYVDPAWSRANLDRIFGMEEGGLGDVAWSTYLISSRMYDDVFRIAEPYYRTSVARMAAGQAGTDGDAESGLDAPLGKHLLAAYLRSVTELGEEESALARFLTASSPALVGSLLGHAGRQLPWPDLDACLVARLQQLWDFVLTHRANEPDALVGFGHWFAGGRFSEPWALEHLRDTLRVTHRVEGAEKALGMLGERLADYPDLVLECVELLVCDDSWHSVARYPHSLRPLLQAAVAHEDRAVRDRAVEIVHTLGNKGFGGYRDLLPDDDVDPD